MSAPANNRQGRPRATRGGRANRTTNQARENARIVYSQPFSTSGLPGLENNIVVVDPNSALAMNAAQNQPQYHNLDPSYIHQNAPPRNRNSNVQILQNIEVRSPGRVVHTSEGMHRPGSMMIPASSGQMYITGQPIHPQRNIRFHNNMLPPGTQLVPMQRGGAQTLELAHLQRPGGQISLLHHDNRMAASNALALMSQAQQGRLPAFNLKEYPEYRFIIYDFSVEHKNVMFRMNNFMYKLYHPIVESGTYMLTAAVNFGLMLCFEVEAKILGDFICKLIPRVLERCIAPFVLELKDAPPNWSSQLKKSIVVGTKNYEMAAKKLADVLKTRKVPLADYAELPPMLQAEFTVRRSFMSIRFQIGWQTAHDLFKVIGKRVRNEVEGGKNKQKVDVAIQTEPTSADSFGLMEQHKAQLEELQKCESKRVYRQHVLSELIENIEKRHEHDLKIRKEFKLMTSQLMLTKLTSDSKKEPRTESPEMKSVEVQTTKPVAVLGFEDLIFPPTEEGMTLEVLSIVKKIILLTMKCYNAILGNIRNLEEENDKLRAELAIYSSSTRGKIEEISPGKYDPRGYKSLPTTSQRRHSSGKQKQPSLVEYLDGYKSILLKHAKVNCRTVPMNYDANSIECFTLPFKSTENNATHTTFQQELGDFISQTMNRQSGD